MHRDLSPSNVLVAMEDGEPVPKVIDFGVAKAVNPEMVGIWTGTITGQVIGKLEYMSPEQAKNPRSGVDIRSDVYALGVLLYELLTGVRPFDLKAEALQRVVQVIDRVDPPTPSSKLETLSTQDTGRLQEIARSRQLNAQSLERTLRRELEWIPLMAMRKEPERRYRNAGDLADDLQAYLSGEVLQAGPESRWYRVRKLMRQYRGPILAVSIIVLLLATGLIATGVLLDRANRAEHEASTLAEERKELLETQVELTASEQAAKLQAKQEAARLAEANREIQAQSYVVNVQFAAQLVANHRTEMARDRLAMCSPELRGWDWGWLYASSDMSLLTLSGHSGVVVSALFSPDGSRIVTPSADNTTRIWDANTGKLLATLRGHSDSVNSASFSPDGTRIVTASDDRTARIWDANTGESLATLAEHSFWVRSASFSPDGTRIVTASDDHTARIWDANTGESLAALSGHSDSVASASFNPDGSRIVTPSADNTTRIWDANTGELLATLTGHSLWVFSASFSPDGTRIITASWDGTARIWDASTSEPLATIWDGPESVSNEPFAPDGIKLRIDALTFDYTVRIWDANTGESLATLAGHSDSVRSAEFSPDGARIVTASRDETVRIWDSSTGELLATLADHSDSVRSAWFSSDGTRIRALSRDDTIRTWDSIPRRIRYAERRANERGEDGSAIVQAWLKAVRRGEEADFKIVLN
ncbi:MAG: protein kinase [Phycisphaerales bacterium JB037]